MCLTSDAREEKAADGCRIMPERCTMRIRPVCASLTGLDIDAEGIEAMGKAGYHVVCGDVASVRLNQKYDLIIAAEVIEHLPNPGLALAILKRILKTAVRWL